MQNDGRQTIKIQRVEGGDGGRRLREEIEGGDGGRRWGEEMDMDRDGGRRWKETEGGD